MKIEFISKYPPIEGYVSSCSYWLARGLASRGHNITVVTNAFEVENEHRQEMGSADLDIYQGKRLRVRNTDPFQQYRLIPAANPFCEKLASAAIEASDGADVLDAWYYVSYGSAGLLAKAATGLPLVLRHAGSDIGRLAANPHMRPLISAMLCKADAVVAGKASSQRLQELGAPKKNIHIIPVAVDTGAFHPSIKPALLDIPDDVPVISCIGKISRGKGILQLLAAAAKVRGDFWLLFVSSDIEGLRRMTIHSRLRKKIAYKRFVPPWRMPGLIRASRAVVLPEHGFPVPGHSPILPREVLACGSCAIISRELHRKVAGGALVDGENALMIDPHDAEGFASRLSLAVRDEDAARRIGALGHELSARIEDFEGYLSANERMYRALAL
jgi:glycosyltransferase involved in cell wall biosynthesis